MLCSILVIRKQLKYFQDRPSPSFEEKFGDDYMGGCDPRQICKNFYAFEIAAYSHSVEGFIFLRFYLCGFVCYVNSGTDLIKLSWRAISELRLKKLEDDREGLGDH